MTFFFDLLRFCELSERLNTLPAEEIADIAAISPEHVKSCNKNAKKVSALKQLIMDDPEKEINSLGLTKKELNLCCLVLEIIQPGVVKKKHLVLFERNTVLDNIKIDTAICIASPQFYHDHEIASELGLPIDIVKARKNRLPVAVGSNEPTFELLKRESHVREFFAIYPHSTIGEASRALKIHHKEVRVIVEDLTKHGEIIKYNNMPKPIEYEKKKLDVIALKLDKPGVTDKEISLALNISIGQVKQAIMDTRRVWKMEMAESHEFYLKKTIGELDIIKDEAIAKSENSKSSRWLELRLMAIEKQINILGLKAPEKVEFNKNITITKKQRDSVLEAYLATDAIEAEFKNVEVTE